MNIESVVYRNLVGARSGLFAFVVTLGGEKTLSPTSLIKEIHGSIWAKNKAVHFQGDIQSTASEEMIQLCRGLRNLQYYVSAQHDAEVYPPWLALLNYKIAELHKVADWPNTECNELWYYPNGNLTEPKLYAGKLPVLYLVPNGLLQENDVFQFLQESTYSWGVLSVPARIFMKVIL